MVALRCRRRGYFLNGGGGRSGEQAGALNFQAALQRRLFHARTPGGAVACMAGISGWWGEQAVGECGDRAGSGDSGEGVRDQRSAAWGREKGSGGAPIWIWTGLGPGRGAEPHWAERVR